VEFEIFEPKSEPEVHAGTVARAKATCLACDMVLPPERVRAQLSEQRGGADAIFDSNGKRIGGARMLAIVMRHPSIQGRNYRLPTDRDYQGVWKAQKCLKAILDGWERSGKKELCPVPDEPLPAIGTLGFRVQRYGMLQWGDLFAARQKVAVATLARLAREWPKFEYGAVREGIAVAIGRVSDQASSLVSWLLTIEAVSHTFVRQALPIVWDFCEILPIGEHSANFTAALDWVTKVVEAWPSSILGETQSADASEHPLPDETARVWFTDPPYYDAVPYADLSDFFFVWLKRALPDHPLLSDPYDPTNPLTPKSREAVQDESKYDAGRQKDRGWFEEVMAKAFAEGRRLLHENGVGSVIFAHKTTEGWEALLSGIIRGDWTITGSWPIATERTVRLRARDSAALATSVHLVCRPRPDDAPVGDWSGVLGELPKRVGDWMERLQSEGVRGADLVFACIGPALEVFSRYSKVETAEGREVSLEEFLEKVWEVVGRNALEQILGTAETKVRNGLAGALEEDARLTALFLWTLQSTNGEGKSKKVKGKNEEIDEEEEIEGDEEEAPKQKKKAGYSLIFDVVRRFAQPLGIHLPEWEGRIIQTEKGVVRLLSIQERAKALFGEDGAQAVADRLESNRETSPQLMLFPQAKKDAALPIKGRKKKQAANVSDEALRAQRGATTLDRVHAAMLLQANGRANALRALLRDEQERGPDFLRLANALSALYPKESEEKRLLDAMLLAMPR
jgi:adenine-specific DNA methylase